MEVVQHPYKAPDGKGVPENQRDFGPLRLGGLEQGDQFEGLDNFGVVFSIIIGRESASVSSLGTLGLPTGEGNPKPGTAYDNGVREAIRELAGFARNSRSKLPGSHIDFKVWDHSPGLTVTGKYHGHTWFAVWSAAQAVGKIMGMGVTVL